MKRLVFVALGLVLLMLAQFNVPRTVQGNDTDPEAHGQALSVNPAVIEGVLEPGKTTARTIVITNLSDVPIPIKASVSDFKPNEALEEADQSGIFQAQTWFHIDEPDFILQPKQARKVAVSITAPSGAEPGGHYATIFFQSLIPEEFVTSDRVYLANRVGVLAFLVVKGEIREKAAVHALSAPSLQQFGPITYSLALKNEGNVHLLPNGKLKIFNWRGKQVDEIAMRPGMVLPHTTRQFEFIWDKTGLFGTYTARAEVSYGSEKQILISPTTRVWIVPWVPLLLLIAAGMPLLWVAWKLKRRGRRVWRALRGQETRFRG